MARATHMSLSYANAHSLNGEPAQRIMLVDDEPSILMSATRSLKAFPHQIDTFEDPREALAHAKHTAYNVVISDQRMPTISGIDLLTKIRALQPDCVTMILSGFTDSTALLEAINRAHIFQFICKPWIDDELISAVKQAFIISEKNYETRKMADRARVHDGSMTRHRACLRDLEARYPGITNVERDENGALLLRGKERPH